MPPVIADAEIDASFEDTPLLGQQEWREPMQYDAITCMFAIHYFFESEKAIKTFLHNVSINLKEGEHAVRALLAGQHFTHGCHLS